MVNKPKSQHYISQFYLKGFGIARNNEHVIWVYNKETMNYFLSNIKKIGMENYFYSKDEAKIIESLFSRLEAKFNIALKRLISTENLDALTYEYKQILSDFIAIQMFRTKEQRIISEELRDGMIQIISEVMVQDYTLKNTSIKDDGKKAYHRRLISESYQSFSEIILNNMIWNLSVNKTDTPLWTSDNPCAGHNIIESNGSRGNMGLLSKGFELHFPLRPHLLLILMKPDIKGSALTTSPIDVDLSTTDLLSKNESLTKDRVTFENNLQIKSSTQFIFSPDNNFVLADEYLAEYPYYRDKNRKRIIIN